MSFIEELQFMIRDHAKLPKGFVCTKTHIVLASLDYSTSFQNYVLFIVPLIRKQFNSGTINITLEYCNK